MRVIHRVHRHTTYGRANTPPALGAGLTQRAQTVLTVGNFTDGGLALGAHLAHLAGAETQGDIATILCQHLNRGAGGAGQLATLTGLHFHVMNRGTQRNVAQRQSVTRLDRRIFTGLDTITGFQATRRQNIATLTIQVFDQGDMSGPVGVVLKALDHTGDTVLVPTKVDATILLLVTTAFMAGGDTAVVITTATFTLRFQQRLIRCTFVQILINHLDHKAAARGSRLSFNNRHDYLLPYLTLRPGSRCPGLPPETHKPSSSPRAYRRHARRTSACL